MPQKNIPLISMNVPTVSMNTNGVYYRGFDRVNYTRDFGSLLYFSGL